MKPSTISTQVSGRSESVVEQAIRAGLKPIGNRPPWQWAEEHVVVDKTSPYPGKWRSANSPFVREIMEVFADNRVRDISVKCSAQSAKTQTIMNCLLWAIAEDPGAAMWVMAAKDEAIEFVQSRLMPMIEECEPVAALLPGNKHLQKTLSVHFETMPLFVTGANSPSKLQSKPIRWLILDEVRNYPPGALDMVLKRTRAFWNARRLLISTPDMENDAVDRAFKDGDQRVWHFPCPSCNTLQRLTFAQMKAEHPVTRTCCRWDEVPGAVNGNVWSIDKLEPQIRYECPHCGHLMADTDENRIHIMNAGKFVRMNPGAPIHRVSFHWNAMLPRWVKWVDVVEEKIRADRALRLGDFQPLKDFINQTLGEAWEDRLKEYDDFGAIETRKANYDPSEPWEDEKTRFIGADVQKDHIRYVCRAIGNDHESSRLIEYGRVTNEAELESKRLSLGVPACNVCIDSAYDSARVYKACLQFKWKAFRGDERKEFAMIVVRPNGKKEHVRRCWALSQADPSIGTKMQNRVRPIKLYLWSNPGVKDILALAIAGIEQKWQIFESVGADYLRELTAEERVEIEDTKGRIHYEWRKRRRDDHWRDCELMIQVASIISGVIRRRKVEMEDPEESDAAEPQEAPSN